MKPCVIILPATSNLKYPKPGRADAVEVGRAQEGRQKKPRSPASSCRTTSPGRTDSCERWDIKQKKIPGSSSSTSSSSSSGSGNRNPARASSCERWDSSSKRPPSRANSADRWDAHKRPRAAAQPDADQEEEQKTIVHKEAPEDETTSKKTIATAASTRPVFSGPTFVSSPEPSMLPMPAFFHRRAGMIPPPAFVQAH